MIDPDAQPKPAIDETATAQAAAPAPAPEPPVGAPRPELPGWYPGWVREIADAFQAGTSCLFVLHGNVHDLYRAVGANGGDATYVGLKDYLATKVFGAWDLVLGYDLAQGLRPLAGDDATRRKAMVSELALRMKPADVSRDPTVLFPALDYLIESVVKENQGSKVKRLLLLFDHAQYLAPEGDLASMSPMQNANLIRFLNWAQNPYIKQSNIVLGLIVDRLSELNDRLLQNPHVTTVEVPLPDRDARLAYCHDFAIRNDLKAITDFTPQQLADQTNGLSLYNIQVVLDRAQAAGRTIGGKQFGALKKELIEQQCQGLLEFVEPKYDFSLLVGQEELKKRLTQDADLLREGELNALPMGYLVTGPVGTGKSFLAECFAGTIGIPCVTLKNFRSKYVGETEGNLEQVLTVLRSLGPVVVVIDEADAALGTRESSGDAGTSSRVFSMIARQMGDTRYRGRILWMLLTSRPDLLPIDLKRQGRAEVHLPLFYPQSRDEMRAMIAAMAKKNKVAIDADALEAVPETTATTLSGSDLESILLGSQRRALTSGRKSVTRDDLAHAFDHFLPSTQGLEKEKQELASVLECTDLEFLPESWRKKVTEPDGRARLQERLVAIKQLLREM
jgi:AAA+ superfamily predicted ATPase